MQIEEGVIRPPKPEAEVIALSEICIILHIIRKPNSIICTKCIKMATQFSVEFSLTVANSSAAASFFMFLS